MVDLVRVVPLYTVHLARGAGKYRCGYREVKSGSQIRRSDCSQIEYYVEYGSQLILGTSTSNAMSMSGEDGERVKQRGDVPPKRRYRRYLSISKIERLDLFFEIDYYITFDVEVSPVKTLEMILSICFMKHEGNETEDQSLVSPQGYKT
uniref:Uncharacterized protein n=1 Tax=Vespula pensylvanica TaxID=30213 RepID=A0A834NZS4_VESPE|nr:hypothetical protein H0235_009919 [Vespula pensylvanica]